MIGIDLGTTNSLVSTLTDGQPRVLYNELEESLIPSAVAMAEDGKILVGRAAKDRLIASPESGRAFFKRDMGLDQTYRFGGSDWTPTECSALILREMKRIAASQLNAPIESAVVTVPAYFHDQQRQATLEAAEIAELKVDRIINEPTSAALAYGYSHTDAETTLLVFDLGGGTFDVTVLEIFEGVVEVRASGGESRLGGEDYTDALIEWVAAEYGFRPSDAERGRWRQRLEIAKRDLSQQSLVTLKLDSDRSIELSQEHFETATASLTAKLLPIVSRCLRDANLQHSDLDDVLLVGGASRMEVVTNLLAQDIKRFPNRSTDPDRAVALGAAVQAGLCHDNVAVSDLVLTDVCPHTLGINVGRSIGPNRQQDGFFSPIIDRNTTVPVSRADYFQTFAPNQDSIGLQIYQGEHRMVADNQLIGEINIKGLRHRPNQDNPGQIEVRFSYDMNGILEIDVTVLHCGKVISKVIEQRPGQLTKRQLEEARARLAPLKIHLRDTLPNRARLERAQRLYVELIGRNREILTLLLDQFEAALESQDAEQVKIPARELDQFISPYFKAEAEVVFSQSTADTTS